MTDTQVLAPPARPVTSPRSHWWALPVLMAGTVMIVLDFFIVNVGLPSIQHDLHATNTALEWIVAGYGLTFSTLMITAGRLGDRFGRARALRAGLLLFGLTSALCGVAPTAGFLVAARLGQGAAAALISPTVLSLIGIIYQGEDRVRAISIYGMAAGLAAAGGQLIGGVLIQSNPAGLGWRSIFLINVPIAVGAAAVARRFVPDSRHPRPPRLDPVGLGLVTIGLVALVLPLLEGRQEGWPAWTIASLAAAPLFMAAFGWHQHRAERTGRQPLFAPSLLRHGVLRAGFVIQLAFWCGQSALFLVLSLYLQLGRGLEPLKAGLVFTVLAGAYLATSMRAPALTGRYGRDLIGVGALALAAGEGGLALAVGLGGTHVGLALLVPGLVLTGAGMGLCLTPLTSVILAQTDATTAGPVSAAMTTLQQVGNTIGVAVTGLLFFGAARHGVGHAFVLSAVQLGFLLCAVGALTRLLPRRSQS